MKKHVKHLHRMNIIVVVVIVLTVIASFIIAGQPAFYAEPSSLTAIVHAGDGQTYRFPLDVDTTATVSSDLGSNQFTVENGSIRATDADCNNHDCVRQGRISTPGQRIICLPHELWVEVVGEKKAAEPSERGSTGSTGEERSDANTQVGQDSHSDGGTTSPEVDTVGS